MEEGLLKDLREIFCNQRRTYFIVEKIIFIFFQFSTFNYLCLLDLYALEEEGMLLLTTFWQQTHAEIKREYAITDMVYARINVKVHRRLECICKYLYSKIHKEWIITRWFTDPFDLIVAWKCKHFYLTIHWLTKDVW